ncbi:TIGR00701 family protein [Gammaproteobacteria bacterium 45_16_T64]|nr:TIGR00701 family protein [Gammaproteobacteria bacterium 45_16_T64]
MLLVKAFHIIAVICWFAGLFYLPRLYVYHVQALNEGDTKGSERFKLMERKLYRGIMTPSAVIALVLGLWMLVDRWDSYFSHATWMHIKLTLIILLLGYHHACGIFRKKFDNDANTRSEKFYRMFNEFPVLILVAVVILAVLKQPYTT